MKTIRRGAALIAACVVMLALSSATAPAKLLDGYCSRTGDYCTRVVARGQKTFLGISTFSFTGKYTLCTRKGSGGRRDCRRFRLHKRGDTYRSFVRFRTHFSVQGSGNYCASWHKLRSRLGPKLCFAFKGA